MIHLNEKFDKIISNDGIHLKNCLKIAAENFYDPMPIMISNTFIIHETKESLYLEVIRWKIDIYFEFVEYFNNQNYGWKIEDTDDKKSFEINIQVRKVENTEKLLNKI